jgi:acyl-CoA synthetase (AMP-forming)/AMP-acid ligase II
MTGMNYPQDLLDKIEKAHQCSKPLEPLAYLGVAELLKEREHDERPWLIWYDIDGVRLEFKYKDFVNHVKQCAAFLTDTGIGKGDRVGTVSHNHWHTVVHYFACWMVGATVVPINLGEDDDRIAFILDFAEVSFAFVRDQYEIRWNTIVEDHGLDKRIRTSICSPDSLGYDADYRSETINPWFSYNESSLIVFTSGTTGNPKAVFLTQGIMLENARSIMDWHGFGWDDRMMCVLPIHHVNGTILTLLTPFYTGSSTVLNQKFQTEHFFERIAREQVRTVSVVPTLLHYLMHHWPNGIDISIPHFKYIICSAGPLTVNTARHFTNAFGIRIIHGYGLSETTCYSCFMPLNLDKEEHDAWLHDHGYPSIGIELPCNDMDIHDVNGNSLPEGERGEIVIRGPNIMQEYYKNEAANATTFAWGWFRSGDEGFWMGDGKGSRYFFITGRLKELIIRGGVNYAPLEIDEVINRAPGVKAGISVGFENDWYGEEIGAYVQLHDGVPEDAKPILNYCREHLPFSKSPKVVIFVDQIPVTSTGKYQRLKVAGLFSEWKEIQFRP